MNREPLLIGREVQYFDKLDSTNTYTLALADDAAMDGLVVIADEQSAGRGQHGRSWSAPAGSSVLMSVLLFPPPALRRPAVLTAWAAVAVCEVIREITDIRAQIKWPNDVLVGANKICGILIEQRSAGTDRLATVAGIGLNVTQPAEWFAQAGLTEATSLALHSHQTSASQDVAEMLVAQLDDEYQRLSAGDLAALETRWQEHLGLEGTQVLVECIDQALNGRFLSATFAGVDVEIGGKNVRLPPEIVRRITVCK